MNLFQRLFQVVFSIYALLIFISSFVLVFPAYITIFNLSKRASAPHIAHGLSRLWGRFLLFMFFIRIKVRGKEKIDPSKAYVFISNHQSQLDIMISAVSCENTFRFLAKAELTKVPVIGYVIRRLYIPVNRKNKLERARSVERMQESLKEGISVFIYPEGTRNKTEKPLLDFYDGAFRLAIEAQVPVGILVIHNSRKLLHPARWMDLMPGKIEVEWLEPLSTKGIDIEQTARLKEKAYDLILDELG